MALLGPGEGPDDDLVQHGTGTEQEPAVEGPAGDLHKRSSFWNESESSAHHPQKTEKHPQNLFVLEPLGLRGGVKKSYGILSRLTMCRPEERTGRSHPDRASRAIRVAPGVWGASQRAQASSARR